MRTSSLIIVAWLLLAMSGLARAEIVVVVNAESGVSELSRDQVVNIYMGRYSGLPSGITAFPVDLQPLKQDFYEGLVNQTLSELNSYWARLVFSGRASPPRQLPDAAAVLEVVSNNKGAIGYLDAADVKESDGVQVVFELAP